MPKLELEIMRLGAYRAVEISAESEEVSGGGTPYYPLLLIKLDVTLKPIPSAEGNPINFVLAQLGGYLSLPNSDYVDNDSCSCLSWEITET